MSKDLSTLICLFHHQDHAQAALEEILKAGIPEANVTLIGGPGSQISASKSTLTELNVPAKDVEHLLDGISNGGAVLAVSAISANADKVEAIFASHKAGKIDEATVADDMSAQALPYLDSNDSGDSNDSNDSNEGTENDLLAPVQNYDPLMPAELEQEGEELVLVTGTVDADGITHIDSIQPVEVAPDAPASQDVDPRELGLDTRMNPGGGYGQVQ